MLCILANDVLETNNACRGEMLFGRRDTKMAGTTTLVRTDGTSQSQNRSRQFQLATMPVRRFDVDVVGDVQFVNDFKPVIEL